VVYVNNQKMHLCSRGRRPCFFKNSEGALRLPVSILDLPVFGSPQIELTTFELLSELRRAMHSEFFFDAQLKRFTLQLQPALFNQSATMRAAAA
jgi:hypothetical protein